MKHKWTIGLPSGRNPDVIYSDDGETGICQVFGIDMHSSIELVTATPRCAVGIERARLIIAAPDLLAAQTMGAELNTPDFLDWIAARLVEVHGENPNVDYIHSLKTRAAAGRAAIAKATGVAP